MFVSHDSLREYWNQFFYVYMAFNLSVFLCPIRSYGINVCGEGGEYETLTLDCPLFCVSLNL